MSLSTSEGAEFFKAMRATMEPIGAEPYQKLYTAVADLVLRSDCTREYYRSSLVPGLLTAFPASEKPSETFRLEERSVTGWVDGVRLAGASIYHLGSLTQQLYGVEAEACVAPVARKGPEDQFVLSTDGQHHWVTEKFTLEPISLQTILMRWCTT
jgi:hypothetical protein